MPLDWRTAALPRSLVAPLSFGGQQGGPIEPAGQVPLNWPPIMHSFPNGSVFYRDLDRPYSDVDRGEGIYLYDRRGKQYIDGSG